jgi:hypothetical protein
MKLRLFVAGILIVMSASLARSQVKYPHETKNAALRYWMAFAEMQDPPADKTIQDLLEKTAAGDATWDETRIGPILDANGEAIRTMQRATRLPQCDWGLEYNRGVRAAIPYVPRARVMARLNQLEGMREMAKGRSQEAVDAWLTGVQFSDHLAKGGTLIFALVAKSALLPNLRSLTAQTKLGHLNDAQKKQVSATMRELREDGFDWAAAWGLEELSIQQLLAELRSATNPRAEYEAVMGEQMPPGAEAPTSEDVGKFRDYMASVQTALNLSPDTAKARLFALDAQRKALPAVIQRLTPSAQKVNDARAEIYAARGELLEALSAK